METRQVLIEAFFYRLLKCEHKTSVIEDRAGAQKACMYKDRVLTLCFALRGLG